MVESMMLKQAACKTDKECPRGRKCIRGKCAMPSLIDDDIPTEEIKCENGRDCYDYGLICRSGVCVDPPPYYIDCSEDSHCPLNGKCINNICRTVA